MKQVMVSAIEVRKKPSMPSKVNIMRNTLVDIVGPPVTYKRESWSKIRTVTTPTVEGYVLSKYLVSI